MTMPALWLAVLAALQAQDPKSPPEAVREDKSSPPEQQATPKPEAPPPSPEDWSIHGQATVISQGHDRFPAHYSGTNSMPSVYEIQTSETATLFLGRRLWEGAQVYVNPEVSGGVGIGNATGLAGFPNGEITRVNVPEPTVYLARAYIKQTFALGAERVPVEPAANRLGGSESVSGITVTFGKMSVLDIFDNNAYASDPRAQFFNWALFADGAWDYPADTRGYTWGAAVEFAQPTWAARYGIFMMPEQANGMTLDMNMSKAHGQVLEIEYRYSVWGRPGKARVLAYLNNARMGNYRDTLNTPSFGMDITLSRTYSSIKYGFELNLEQELTPEIGAFARLGWDDGETETFAFTEIDRTVSVGAVFKGALWGRPADKVGAAVLVNGLSNPHRVYLGAGGLGFIIGDGNLTYGWESFIEVFYSFKIIGGLFVTADFQQVFNPAYNQDRGPISIWAIRVHFEF